MSKQAANMLTAEPFPTDRLVEAAYLLSDDPVLVVEWPTRRILACNDAVSRIFGFTPKELLGNDTRALHVSQAAFESFGATIEAFLGSDHATYHCQYRMRRKDGTEFPTENLVQLIHDVHEGHVAVVSFIRDLSGCSSIEQPEQSMGRESAHALSMYVSSFVFRRVRDPHGQDRYTYIAGRLLYDLGIDPEAARNDPNVILNLIESNDHYVLESVIKSSVKHLSGIDLVIRLRSPNGSWFWIRTISRPTRLEDGSVVWDGIAINISAERQAQEQVAWLANHDRLTGLLNRAALSEHIESSLKWARTALRQFVLVHLGVRGMSTINEMYGLQAGDALLHQIADRLINALPDTDTIARSHSDCFLVALEIADNESDTVIAIEKVRSVFQSPFDLGDGDPVQIEVSVGIARYPDDADTTEGLLRAVALAGERARERPELHYAFYDHEQGERMRHRFRLTTNLRQAIADEQLEAYYQPQISLTDGSLVGMEALVRWPSDDGSLVYPGDFIPLAEESGLSGQIGRLMFRRVARDLHTWSRQGHSTVAVAVNCSARHFKDTDLIEAYTQEVLEQGIAPGRVHLEITESSLIDNMEHAERTMAQLNAMGANFSIDDFGTGFSALLYLSRLPFRVLKIDRSFVSHILDDAHQRNLVLGLVRLASTIGLYVIAEGVETIEQEEELRRIGCDAVQGFYYAPALPADQLEPWFARA